MYARDIRPGISRTSLAQGLNDLNLLRGVGTDSEGNPIFDLDRALTRLEALALVIRLMGLEGAANAYTGINPFTDVTNWGDRYVAFGFSRGITVGVNNDNTLFAPDRLITYQEFTAFLLRVLEYSEANGDFEFADALRKAYLIGMYPSIHQNRDTILRSDAALAMSQSLLTRMNSSVDRLIDVLVGLGVISQTNADSFITAITG